MNVRKPVGLMQTWASVVFATGAIAVAAFVIGLRTGGSTRSERFRMPAGRPLSANQ